MLVSSAEETAKDVYSTLRASGLAASRGRRASRGTSSSPPATRQQFRRVAHHFLGPVLGGVDPVDVRVVEGVPVELTVLGLSGTWPNADTATSGYLVQHDGFNLWMDAGTGTLANLQQHIDIPRSHAIVISHEHPDHFVDLYPAFYAWHYGELGRPGLPVFVPTDFTQKLADVVSIDSQVAMRTAFAFTEVAPGEAFEIGPFRVKTEPMAHLGLPALGFRVAADGQVLAYTGRHRAHPPRRGARARTPTCCSPRPRGRTATTSCRSTCRRDRPRSTRASPASASSSSRTSGRRSTTRSRRTRPPRSTTARSTPPSRARRSRCADR